MGRQARERDRGSPGFPDLEAKGPVRNQGWEDAEEKPGVAFDRKESRPRCTMASSCAFYSPAETLITRNTLMRRGTTVGSR